MLIRQQKVGVGFLGFSTKLARLLNRAFCVFQQNYLLICGLAEVAGTLSLPDLVLALLEKGTLCSSLADKLNHFICYMT